MKAGQFFSGKDVRIKQVQKPIPKKDEALIKVSSAGICGTDMMIFFGKHPRAEAPLIMGHEFSGIIDSINGVSDFTVGDRVVIEPTISCGKCPACEAGQMHVCQELKLIGIDMDGGFAEYVTVPINRLHRVPKELSLSVAALAEPLAVAVHTVRRSSLKIGENVAILGAGPIGLLIGMIAKLNGANNIFISDISPYRLEKAKDLGLHPINAGEKDVVDGILSYTNGKLIDTVFEVAGTETTLEQTVKLIKTQGKIVVVSVFKNRPLIDLTSMHFNEISLTTTRCYSKDDFRTAIDIMAGGKVDISAVISHQLKIEEIEKGFSLMGEPDKSLKILIQP
ncbi:zinc-dependent alcohol dehydrogenase [Oceanobacillus alkalisoli]|uniref:zinc-dependent alcohol dehydrogenase n=1 Tax=Oceanobacillus alkalisoli TaxID=2925113 RepID=UPI001EE4A8BC|nr:alcohol dehydrogenase catalytic domain-containing protein [Oceanobacillus alkalisoli]MCG5103218.1 alcohol dehydrogenase catalytic domain-containing protein [Oceanobacillus alkalisoli]